MDYCLLTVSNVLIHNLKNRKGNIHKDGEKHISKKLNLKMLQWKAIVSKRKILLFCKQIFRNYWETKRKDFESYHFI